MVTISPIRNKHNFLASIRWKILLAFFLIVAVSFIVAATNLTGIVSEYMYQQREREDSASAEKLSQTLAPLFERIEAEEIRNVMAESAATLNGRLMLIDPDGKIQYDTFHLLCGQRLKLNEVLSVLAGEKESDYGMHSPGRETVAKMSGETDAEYVAYCTHSLNAENGSAGVLLYVSRVQEMMDSVHSVSRQLSVVFIVIAVGALILALILSQILTKPITTLSRTMSKMGKGDLSVRVPVKGSGELRELAENYNTMASQLESIDKTRSQFVSNASHELKTPLATMKIMLETILYQPDMPTELRQEFMQDMNHEIDRLTGIITDLLTLSRMDHAGDQLVSEALDMSELTAETVRLLRPVAEKKEQTIAEDIMPGLKFTGDRTKLNQILYNLTENAIKYTPEKGTIRVSLKQQGDELIWKVRDNGIGIPEEDREHIFERFYRVDKARSRETGGTGLGLSIVRQFVNMHGGTIRVDSVPNQGTEFTVVLPVEGGDRK